MSILKEKNRNKLKLIKESKFIPQNAFGSTSSKNQSLFQSNLKDESSNEFAPITHLDIRGEYKKMNTFFEKNQIEQAKQILVKMINQLQENLPEDERDFEVAIDFVLNYWKFFSQMKILKPLHFKKLQKIIPALAKQSEKFKTMNQKLKNRINLLLIILMKEYFEEEQITQSYNLSEEFFQKICLFSDCDDMRLKFRYLRLKIFNKLQKQDQQFEEINACESLLKNMKDQNQRNSRVTTQSQFQNKNQLKRKLEKRKNEILSSLKGKKYSKSFEKSGNDKNFGKNSNKSFKCLNLESTAAANTQPNFFIRKKSFSLNKHKKSGSNFESNTDNENRRLAQRVSGEGFLPLQSQDFKLNTKNQIPKRKTTHHHERQRQGDHLRKCEEKPLLQYKKLTKKPLMIKYKENDLKELLNGVKNDDKGNNYNDLLLHRPYAEPKSKKKQTVISRKQIGENNNDHENKTDREDDRKSPSSSAIVNKKDTVINKCVNQIQNEVISKFVTKIENIKKVEPYNCGQGFQDSDHSSQCSQFQSKLQIQDEAKQTKPIHNPQDYENSAQKSFIIQNLFLSDHQTTYKLKISGKIRNKYPQTEKQFAKCWLYSSNQVIYFPFQTEKQKNVSNFYKQRNNNNNSDEDDIDTEQNLQVKKSSFDAKSIEREKQYSSYWKKENIVLKIKEELRFENKGLGLRGKIENYGNEVERKNYIFNFIQNKNQNNGLMLNRMAVKTYVEYKKSFECILQEHSNRLQFNCENFLFEILKNLKQKSRSQQNLIKMDRNLKNKRKNKEKSLQLSSENSINSTKNHKKLETICHESAKKIAIEKNDEKIKAQHHYQPPQWIENCASIVSQFMMKNAENKTRSHKEIFENKFFLAVKSFLTADQPYLQSVINIFFNIKTFKFVSCLSHSKKKVYEITVKCYELKDLYKNVENNLWHSNQYFPFFIKFNIVDKFLKTKVDKFVLTFEDIKNIIKNYSFQDIQEESMIVGGTVKEEQLDEESRYMIINGKKMKIFKVFQQITTKIKLYKKITYSHLGVIDKSEEKHKFYKANRLRYTNNKFLLQPIEFLSPHLESINIIYQRPIRILCDKTYSVITVLKIKGTEIFDLRIYVPKYQRVYSFSFSYEIFAYFKQEELKRIFQKEEEEESLSLPSGVTLDQIRQVLSSEEQDKKIWSQILGAFKFYRKYNVERSYLVVKISGYETFTKDCAICEYFGTRKNSSSFEEEENKNKNDSILRMEISMEMNKSGLNFLHHRSTQNRRNRRSIRTVFSEHQKMLEEKTPGNSQTYHESLGNIYESQTNKYIIYLSIIDTMTSEKVVYSYFLCELIHLLSIQLYQKQINSENINRKQFETHSTYFKEKTLNHATLWEILNMIKNVYLLKIQTEADVYLPDIFTEKQIMNRLKKQIDLMLLKEKVSKKISLNSEIFNKNKEVESKISKIVQKKKMMTSKERKRQETEENKNENIEDNVKNKQNKNCEQTKNLIFLHKKILLLPQKKNPISCIVYDLNEKSLKIFINNYKVARIKQLKISLNGYSIPNINSEMKSVVKILKCVRKRLFRYHENLIMFM